MDTKKRKPKPFTVYFPSKLDLWIRCLARKEGRSLTRQTCMLIEAGRKSLYGK